MAVQYGSCIFFHHSFPTPGPSSHTVPSSFSAAKAHPVPTKSIARPAISTTLVLLLLQQSCHRGTVIPLIPLIPDTLQIRCTFNNFHTWICHDASKLLLAVACHPQRAKNPSIWPPHQTVELQRQHLWMPRGSHGEAHPGWEFKKYHEPSRSQVTKNSQNDILGHNIFQWTSAEPTTSATYFAPSCSMVSCTSLLFPPEPPEPHVTTRPSARTAAKASAPWAPNTRNKKARLGAASFAAWSLATLMVGLQLPLDLPMMELYAALPFGATSSLPDSG